MRGNAAATSVCTKHNCGTVQWVAVTWLSWCFCQGPPMGGSQPLRELKLPSKRKDGDQSLGHQLQAIMEDCKCYLSYRDSWRPIGVRHTWDFPLQVSSEQKTYRHLHVALLRQIDWEVYVHRQSLDITEARTCAQLNFFLCSVITTLASLECVVWTLLWVSSVRPVPQDIQDKLCKG